MRISQQTSTVSPLTRRVTPHAELGPPEPVRRDDFSAPLQLLLERPGWTVLQAIVDFTLVLAVVVLALGGTAAVAHISATSAPLLAMPPLAILLLSLGSLYRAGLRVLILDGVLPILSAVSVATVIAAAIGMLVNGRLPDEEVLVRAWLWSVLAIGVGRGVMSFAQRLARRRRLIGRPVLIVGAGLVGSQIARRLKSHPEYGLVPVGFIDDDPLPMEEVGSRDVPVLGFVQELDMVLERTGAKRLIVAFSNVADARVSPVVQRCQELGIEVSVVPRLFDTINDRVGYDTVGGMPLMSFASVNPKGFQFAVKHAIDRIAAAGLLIVLAPLIAILAIAVALSSPGPVLFRQRRIGRDGSEFDLYKFRSMRLAPVPALADGQNGAKAVKVLAGADRAPGGVEGWDRRTRLGRLLRRTSLDELPQLVNVLKGDMSLIGPRPERPEFVELFGRDVARYADRHRVKSGITGWAQVHGLRGPTSLEERVEWDNYYIAHWSLRLDLKIVLLTFLALLHDAD